MKFGIAVSTYETQFGPIVFRDGHLAQNIKDIAALGYDGVDLFVDRKTDEELLAIKALFEEGGVEINTYLAIFLAEMGVKLSEIDPAKRQRDIGLFKEQIDKAQLIGANAIALGFIRGGIGEGDTYQACLDRLTDSLNQVGPYAAKRGITIGLEPINRYELNLLNRVDETADYIKNNGFAGVGALIDTFHMNIEDVSFEASIKKAAGMISNVHAPSSHRRAAGTGHLPYEAIFASLKEIGYDGYVTLEAFGEPDPVTCAKTSIEFYKKYL